MPRRPADELVARLVDRRLDRRHLEGQGADRRRHRRLGPRIPGRSHGEVMAEGISWNYTSWLDILFLALSVVLLVRFFRTGGMAMMRNAAP